MSDIFYPGMVSREQQTELMKHALWAVALEMSYKHKVYVGKFNAARSFVQFVDSNALNACIVSLRNDQYYLHVFDNPDSSGITQKVETKNSRYIVRRFGEWRHKEEPPVDHDITFDALSRMMEQLISKNHSLHKGFEWKTVIT